MAVVAPRVLFVGDDWHGSNATSLRNAIIRSGHDCLTVVPWSPDIRWRVARKIRPTPEQLVSRQQEWNRRFVETARLWKPDLVVVFKGLTVTSETIAVIPGIKIHYHPDDSTNPYNRSPVYEHAETAYDLHVTTKSMNVSELKSRGVRNALFVRCAYDRDWHVALDRPSRTLFDVGFIGTRRRDRVPLIKSVADRYRKAFLLCGGRWNREPALARVATVRPPQFGFKMSVTVAKAPVQLGLLNSDNRDQHTVRSYEVPAAGGVMVAERTIEHLEMLEEGTEALFFSSEEEMFAHIERLRTEPDLVAKISLAAARRVRSQGNTYEDRWRSILAEVDALGPWRREHVAGPSSSISFHAGSG